MFRQCSFMFKTLLLPEYNEYQPQTLADTIAKYDKYPYYPTSFNPIIKPEKWQLLIFCEAYHINQNSLTCL